MKMCFITLLALVTTGFDFGAQSAPGTTPLNDLGASSFPTGKYTSCAQGAHNPSGNSFLNASGFQEGAVLTLSLSGTTVASTYTDRNGATQSLSFSATTGTTATLAHKGQVIHGFTSLCVQGPGNEKGYPASMTVNAGTLTYNASTVLLNLTGSLQSNAGACGKLSQPEATFWIFCEERQGGALPSIEAGPSPVTKLAGQYSCNTQVETLYSINGMKHYVSSGTSGLLTLTAEGPKITGRYNGDPSLTGTLRFRATTPTAAIAEGGQNLMAPCTVPMRTGVPPETPEPFPIAIGTLTLTDSTLFLSFGGTTTSGSSCPGAKMVGSLICTRAIKTTAPNTRSDKHAR